MRFPLLCCLASLVAVCGLTSFAETRNGYITEVDNAGGITLDMKPVRITPETKIRMAFPGRDSDTAATFSDLLPGVQATVKGSEDAKGHEFTATKLTFFQVETKPPFKGWSISDRPPRLTLTGTRWSGKVYADGYELAVDEKTVVQLPADIESVSALPPSVWVRYKAQQMPEGGYKAISVAFLPNEKTDKEQRFDARVSGFKITPPDYPKGQKGKVSFGWTKIVILPDQQGVDYITHIVESLLPAWQKSLPEGDPLQGAFSCVPGGTKQLRGAHTFRRIRQYPCFGKDA